MAMHLTRNGIAAIDAGDVNAKPVLQVLEINVAGRAQERYVLLLSDSTATQQAMLATQLNDRIKSGLVRRGSIVQLIDYISTTLDNHKIIVVLNMETIIADCEPIGTPTHRVNKPVRDMDLSARKGSRLQSNNNTTQRSFGPTVQPAYRPAPTYPSHGSIVKNEAPPSVIPIAALNQYQGGWAIRARVTAKSDLRRYNNARGDGKVFSFDLLDSDGGEIRATCFNSAADRFFDVITAGNVYTLSKGSLKPARKSFNHLNNDWEVFLDPSSVVQLQEEDDGSIAKRRFSFRTVAEVEDSTNGSIVDLIAVVTSVSPSVPVLRRDGLETQRRSLTLTDPSRRSIELTLWGDFCNREGRRLEEMTDAGRPPVLAVKAGKVNDFSGKCLGTVSATQLFIDPDLDEAESLMGWFRREGKLGSVSRDGGTAGVRKTLFQIKAEGLGRSEKPDWATVIATVTLVKTDGLWYTACPLTAGDRRCSKKVVRAGGGGWRCDRCEREVEECDYRYVVQAQVQDHTGPAWVTAFQEAGEEIMGRPAQELYRLKQDGEDGTGFREAVRSRLFARFLLKLKIKEEVYGEEQRLKVTVVKAVAVDCSAESRLLLAAQLSGNACHQR